MMEESKGFCNGSDDPVERKEPKCTKRGIVIYKGKGDKWYLSFPDDTEKISNVTAIKLMTLIYHLKETDGNIDKSKKELRWK